MLDQITQQAKSAVSELIEISKIKSGDIYEVLSVVKALMIHERTKGLSTSERKMLNMSKKILSSEIVLSGAADMSDVENIFNDTISEILK